MEGRQRRSFTDDYKRQAVDLVASSGRSIGSVAKELGLRDSVLRRWVEQRGARREPMAASRRPTTQATLPSADHAAEIARLQRENERLRVERDILENRSRSLLEFRNEIPLHRRSPRRLSGDDHVRRARCFVCWLLCLAGARGEPASRRQP
jgi:transposase